MYIIEANHTNGQAFYARYQLEKNWKQAQKRLANQGFFVVASTR